MAIDYFPDSENADRAEFERNNKRWLTAVMVTICVPAALALIVNSIRTKSVGGNAHVDRQNFYGDRPVIAGDNTISYEEAVHTNAKVRQLQHQIDSLEYEKRRLLVK